jgi:hypothetical protein
MSVYGFHCKTPGWQAFLVVGELAEDMGRKVHVPINLGDDLRKFSCPDCMQAHDNYFSEHIIANPGE